MELIDRQEAINAIWNTEPFFDNSLNIYQKTVDVIEALNDLPSVRTEGIPIKWILEWSLNEEADMLRHRDNQSAVSVIAKMIIDWDKEQGKQTTMSDKSD